MGRKTRKKFTDNRRVNKGTGARRGQGTPLSRSNTLLDCGGPRRKKQSGKKKTKNQCQRKSEEPPRSYERSRRTAEPGKMQEPEKEKNVRPKTGNQQAGGTQNGYVTPLNRETKKQRKTA